MNWLKSGLATLVALFATTLSCAQQPTPTLPKRILLIPVDDRPAVAQFAQMIGAMAGVQVVTPPSEFLGKFLQPGSPPSILNWMRSQDLSSYDAVIVSADMIAYGGLIASRVDRSSYNLAANRLTELWRVRKLAPRTPFYVFSAVMRIAPTATDESLSYRTDLYYWAIAKEKYRQTHQPETLRAIQRFENHVSKDIRDRYVATRERNNQIQTDLVRMTYHGAFNRLVFGQDDATPIGPQVPELAAIDSEIDRLKLQGRISYCAGIDQVSNDLVSLILTDLSGFRPSIKISYADNDGKNKVAAYETISIEQSLRDQVETSGGKIAKPADPYDYTLYVNTPDPNPTAFEDFLTNLKMEADQGFPVAVADANLGWTGTADPELFTAIATGQRAPRLLGYAGWNTAGNTMGTTIPAANVYLLARHFKVDPYLREVALRTFLLHRLVNDYHYHRDVRPAAYKMIEELQNGRRDQVQTQENYDKVNRFVHTQMLEYLNKTFDELFKGRPFVANGITYRPVGLKNVIVRLPWPRAYEVFIDFDLDVQPVDSK